MSGFPDSVAELGPGTGLGVGLCALLSGCKKYLALDVVQHTDQAQSERVLDELLEMFKSRALRFRNQTLYAHPEERRA